MDREGTQQLDKDQTSFLSQLNQAVTQINQADELLELSKPDTTGVPAARATAMLLSAIARVLVIQTAEQHGMNNRLLPFTKK